jgi:hypothetical protein
MSMQHEYSDNMVTPWGGMKEMKMLIDKTGISKKLLELGLPQGKSNNSIDSISIIESFWVSIWIGCFRFSHTAVVRCAMNLKLRSSLKCCTKDGGGPSANALQKEFANHLMLLCSKGMVVSNKEKDS